MPKRKWFPFESRQSFLSEGVNEAWYVTHISVGREIGPDSEYLIPNEWIASSIGTHLRLPIPPFALMRNDPTHAGMFTSFRFGGRTKPQDMIPDACVKADPDLCTGILLFDILVANGDRHRANLKVDDPLKPKEFSVFDHDRALFFVEKGKGKQRLLDVWDKLGVSGGSQPGDSKNCLLEAVNTSAHFDKWLHRIAVLPKWFLEDIVREVNDWLTEDEMDTAKSFLFYRSRELANIIKAHKHKFTAIADWGIL